jgi:predicted nucleotidyltransferase
MGVAMIASVKVQLPEAEIERFCQRWKISEFALFGSVLREDFRPDSDIDVLVTFAPGTRWSLFDMARMERDLEAILGRRVDLVERKAVESSENYIRRKHILSNLLPVYVAG